MSIGNGPESLLCQDPPGAGAGVERQGAGYSFLICKLHQPSSQRIIEQPKGCSSCFSSAQFSRAHKSALRWRSETLLLPTTDTLLPPLAYPHAGAGWQLSQGLVLLA